MTARKNRMPTAKDATTKSLVRRGRAAPARPLSRAGRRTPARAVNGVSLAIDVFLRIGKYVTVRSTSSRYGSTRGAIENSSVVDALQPLTLQSERGLHQIAPDSCATDEINDPTLLRGWPLYRPCCARVSKISDGL